MCAKSRHWPRYMSAISPFALGSGFQVSVYSCLLAYQTGLIELLISSLGLIQLFPSFDHFHLMSDMSSASRKRNKRFFYTRLTVFYYGYNTGFTVLTIPIKSVDDITLKPPPFDLKCIYFSFK